MALTKNDINQIKYLIDNMDITRIREAVREDTEEIVGRRIDDFAIMVSQQFLAIDKRFDRLEERIDRLEIRMTQLEERMDRLDARMTSLESRMDSLEERVYNLEARMTSLAADVAEVKLELRRVEIRSREDSDVETDEIVSLNRRVKTLEHQVRKLESKIDL